MNGKPIAVIGAGYVGLVYAACMAELGHFVTCVDTDVERVAQLQRGNVPIFEPGLAELVRAQLRSERLLFTSDYEEALAIAEFVFIAVSTPSTPEGAADLRCVRSAARAIAVAAGGRRPIIVNKSTVPVGTGDSVDHILTHINGHPAFHVVSNPEFLREGSALGDFFHPDRIVLGARDHPTAEKVAALYEGLDAPVLITDTKTAEMIKYASNAFLATKVSFINEIAEICAAVGADASRVSEGMSLDARIGPHFLRHGLGFGGSCLPKDVRALAHMGSVFGTHPQLLTAVLEINAAQRRRVLQQVRAHLGTLEGAQIGILGLAFKPQTDDVRDAPALDLIRLFINDGATVRAFDPQANDNARALCPEVDYFTDPYEAARGCDALVVATEWPEFRDIDLALLRSLVSGPLLVDGRGILDRQALRQAGFDLPGQARGSTPPAQELREPIGALR